MKILNDESMNYIRGGASVVPTVYDLGRDFGKAAGNPLPKAINTFLDANFTLASFLVKVGLIEIDSGNVPII